MHFTILIIDDEKNIREGLKAALEMDGYAVRIATDGKDGLAQVAQGDIDLVITDLRMPVVSGEEVLAKVTAETPGIPVIVLTGHGSIDTAVNAMRQGAYDFLTKPLNLDRLSLLVKRALQRRELILQHRRLEDELTDKHSFESIIGTSPEMQKVFEMVRRTANSKASMLVTGESGVGKELVAEALHKLSSRRDKPLIKVHCAALSENLLESELFGHEKGAFTGATARHRGKFELASGGTIFLDEIGEIDQNVQIKLLRVLQDKRFERVGSEETLEVDVRVIAATNRDLLKEIDAGRFREDLYYRLNVVQIHIPPLRERKEDIPLLINQFLLQFAQENNKRIEGIDGRARTILYQYDWPGNVRQLRNIIEGAVILCTGNSITVDDLPPTITGIEKIGTVAIPTGTTLEEAEKMLILQTMAACKGNKSRAADVLGIGRKTLHRKLDEYKIGWADSE